MLACQENTFLTFFFQNGLKHLWLSTLRWSFASQFIWSISHLKHISPLLQASHNVQHVSVDELFVMCIGQVLGTIPTSFTGISCSRALVILTHRFPSAQTNIRVSQEERVMLRSASWRGVRGRGLAFDPSQVILRWLSSCIRGGVGKHIVSGP